MNTEAFISDYLKPSLDGLDRSFTLVLPGIPDLHKNGEFIVQGRQDKTFSTNIITKYESTSAGIRLVEVYKNTEEQEKGIFVRLVGTISLVKKGYPFLFLDAAVSNVSPLTTQQEPLTTRIAIHLPQAGSEQRKIFSDVLNRKAESAGLAYKEVQLDKLPDFWGPLWSVHAEGLNLELIATVREFAWESYNTFCGQIEETAGFDYGTVQRHMVFKHSQIEHHLFTAMGLSVPAEAQAAFFSVLVAGV